MHLERHSLGPVVLAALLVSAASAQTITPLALEGDTVTGVGNVTSITGLSIGSDGLPIVEVDTDNPDSNADNAVLVNGVLYQVENQALAQPAGALLDIFDATFRNQNGNIAQNLGLDGTSGTNDDSGIYWNANLLIQEGDISTVPGLSVGTPYIGFFEVRINDAEQVLVLASIDDPNVASTVDRALLFLNVDPNTGTVASESLVYAEGSVIPALAPEAITDFGTSPYELALNEAGDVLYSVDLTGATTDNSAVLVTSTTGDTLIAREGQPSPVAGRNWASLSGASLDLNDAGDWVMRANLDGDTATNAIIVKNGVKLVQEGDGHPAIPGGLTFTSFGTGPLEIDNQGNVLWFGDWNDPDTNIDTGLFLNDMLLVQEGVTVINGLVVDNLFGVEDGFFSSRDGSTAIFEAQLAGSVDGAFLIDLTRFPTIYCTAKASSAGCLAAIGTAQPGQPVSGANDYTAVVDMVQGGKNGILFFGLSGPAVVPFQGGTLCVLPPLGRTPVQNSMGSGPVSCDGMFSLVVNTGTDPFDSGPGNTTWFQSWYRDPALMDGFDTALSNAIALTFQ